MVLLLLYLLLSTVKTVDSSTCTAMPGQGRNDCDGQHGCTVKEGTPVDLVCGSCPPGLIGIQWFKWDKQNQRFEEMSESKSVVHFDKVTMDMTDCYNCVCLYDISEISSSFINLQVHPVQDGKPRCIATGCVQNSTDTYTLTTKYPELKTHHKGRVCINATCTGNGTLHYKWFRKNGNGDFDPIDSVEFIDSACDSGVHINSTPNESHLCILPTIQTLCTNGDRIQHYKVNVSNDFGSIVVHATVEFPDMSSGGCSWFMRLHEKQSYGDVSINTDGTGTAHCAVYHEDLDINIIFYLCKIESSKKGLSACYFQDLQRRNQCKQCDDTSEGFDAITFKSETVSNRLGMYSRGCVVRSLKPEKGQMYSCIAKREISPDRVNSSLQGPEWSDPQEIGTFQFTDPPPELLTSRDWEAIFIPSGILLVCLMGAIVIAGFVFSKYSKANRDYRNLLRQRALVRQGSEPSEHSEHSERSVVTEFSSLLPSDEGRRDYGSLEGTGGSSASGTTSTHSSSSNTASIVDFETKSKVAEIDLESSPPSSRDSACVVHLPPGKRYECTLGPEGKKFDIYTDYVVAGESAEQRTLRDVSHLPDHIEEIVPISMANLLDFVDSMAGCWERIGIKLGLGDKVDELRQVAEKFSNGSNLIILLEAWLENKRGVSWGHLIHILESSEVNLGTVADNIKDFLFKQVPVIPENIDFLVPMSVPNLMHFVASFAQHWETIGQLLKLKEEVEKLKKAPYTNLVKMTFLLESWATLEQEFSWLNLLEKCEGRHELRPLVANIRQHLLKKRRELHILKPTSATSN